MTPTNPLAGTESGELREAIAREVRRAMLDERPNMPFSERVDWRKERADLAAGQILALLPQPAEPALERAAREIDRFMLVIESAVRNADPGNWKAVLAALNANRDAVREVNRAALRKPQEPKP